MNVRVAVPEDLEGIHAIEQSAFSTPWSKASLEAELKNPVATYLVAEEETVIGYIGMWEVMGEGQMTNVAVHKAYRGQKIGKRLVLELINYSKQKGLQILILEVRQSNEIAQNLYKTMGFKEIAIRKNYYSDPKEDALILQLDL